MDFQTWFDNADMPEKVDGIWVDLEDGIAWNPTTIKTPPKPKYSANDETKSYRQYAAQFGGKALTGSTAQKKWAEKLRFDRLKQLDKPTSEFLCKHLTYSKAWINMRSEGIQAICSRVELARKLCSDLTELDLELKKLPRTGLTDDEQLKLTRIAVKADPLNRAMDKFRNWDY